MVFGFIHKLMKEILMSKFIYYVTLRPGTHPEALLWQKTWVWFPTWSHSQSSVTQGPGDPTPSSGLHSVTILIYMQHIHIYIYKTHITITRKFNNVANYYEILKICYAGFGVLS